MDSSGIILLSLLTPLATACCIMLSRRRPNLRECSTIAGSIILFALISRLVKPVLDGNTPAIEIARIFKGVGITFLVEPLGLIFAILASLLWIANSIYSIGYMRGNKEKHQTRFYIFFALAIFSTIGIAFAGDLLTLFVFYEGLTLSTYPLVIHKGNDQAIKAGRLYLGILLSTSIGFLLLAIIWTWSATGLLDFRPGGILPGQMQAQHIPVLLLLFAYGIGKAALLPIHLWLPAAMIAPTPVSALLHAVAVVKAGVFTITKIIIYIFGADYLLNLPYTNILLYLSGITIIYASIIALRSDNLKRRLAYSTISQLSYIIMAAALFAPLAITGGIIHIVAHAFGKITLFFAAGSIYTVTRKTNVSQLAGIGRSMPITMTAFAIGCMSMIGLPPTAGFISKWYILQGAFLVEAWFAVTVIVLSTLLNAAYFLPIIHTAFFDKAEEAPAANEAPAPMLIALSGTAILTLLFFFMPGGIMRLAQSIF